MVEQDGILNVSAGQIVTGETVTDGNTQIVLSGGKVYDTLISGGNQIISSGGFVSNVTLDGGDWTVNDIRQGSQTILSGGSAFDTHISLGYQTVSDGAITSGTSIFFLGSQTILSGGREENVTIYDTGFQYVSSGGVVENVTISGQGWQSVYSGGVVSNAIINSAGRLLIDNGGYVNNMVVNGGGIDIDGTVSNAVINSGGYVGFGLDGKAEGEFKLNPGGSAMITTSNGGVINLVGNENSGLTIIGEPPLVNWEGNSASVTTKITDFSGNDSIEIDYYETETGKISNIVCPDDDHITITIDNGFSLTLNIVGIKQTGYSFSQDDYGALYLTVCFLSGTEIRIKDGVANIETLQAGDLITTYDWVKNKYVERKVTWAGHKHCRVNKYLPDDVAGYPVRILKGAISENIPHKDLLITAEHCLFFEDKFIPVRMLVNGSTIYYDYSITSYDYYHIETDQHAVIIADGMFTESYLDTGNRHVFNHHHKVIETSLQNPKDWKIDAAAPLAVAREVVEPLYNQFNERAQSLNADYKGRSVQRVNDSDLHLVTDQGQIIRQKRVVGEWVTFIVPSTVKHVWINSRHNRLCDVIGPFVDNRHFLGVCVGEIMICINGKNEFLNILREEENLEGWHAKQKQAGRWTTGKALLPIKSKNIDDNPVLYISLQILAGGPYLEYVTEDEDKANLVG